MREGSNSKLALTLLLSLVIITGSYVTVTNYITTDTEQNQVVECSEGEELVEGNCIAEEVHNCIPGRGRLQLTFPLFTMVCSESR